jgi:hypothetical protein
VQTGCSAKHSRDSRLTRIVVDESVRDVDGLEEDRKATVSVFDGPEPTVLRYPSSVSLSSNSFTVHSFAGCLTSRD